MTAGRMMRAVVVEATDGGFAFRDAEREIPEPGPRDLLVEIEAVGFNPVDLKQAARTTPGSPQIVGYDACGRVVAAGADVVHFAPGERVFYAGSIKRPGAHAQYQTVDERLVARAPLRTDPSDAATMSLVALTAWEGVVDRFRLRADSRGVLLVVGASGGAGAMAVQLVRALAPGMRIIATASRPETRARVRALGADEVVSHHDLRDGVLRLAPGGVDYVFTSYSSGRAEVFADIVRPFGEITSIDLPEDFDFLVLKDKCISWHWERMFARSRYQTPDMSHQGEILRRLAALVEEGLVVSDRTRTFRGLSAENVREATRILGSETANGKLALVL